MAQKKKPTRHRSALKAHRQSIKRNIYNRSIKKQMRLTLRAASDAAAAKDAAKLNELLAAASAAIDKAAQKGSIHWKTAARKKSRLAQRARAAVAA